jgi:hypothetical protein
MIKENMFAIDFGVLGGTRPSGFPILLESFKKFSKNAGIRKRTWN